MSPIRGDLLPTTLKFMKQGQERSYPSNEASRRRESPTPSRYSSRQYDDSPAYVSRRGGRGSIRTRASKRDYPSAPISRRRSPPTSSSRPYRSTRPSRPIRSSRGRGASSRGGRSRIDVSPIRAAGEFDDSLQEVDCIGESLYIRNLLLSKQILEVDPKAGSLPKKR